MDKPDIVELEPCPFCNDPMRAARSGSVQHVDVSELNDCVIARVGFTDITAWNQRADTPEITRLRAQLAAARELAECVEEESAPPSCWDTLAALKETDNG